MILFYHKIIKKKFQIENFSRKLKNLRDVDFSLVHELDDDGQVVETGFAHDDNHRTRNGRFGVLQEELLEVGAASRQHHLQEEKEKKKYIYKKRKSKIIDFPPTTGATLRAAPGEKGERERIMDIFLSSLFFFFTSKRGEEKYLILKLATVYMYLVSANASTLCRQSDVGKTLVGKESAKDFEQVGRVVVPFETKLMVGHLHGEPEKNNKFFFPIKCH